LGNTQGTANPAYVYAEGIFTDAQAQNIVIKDNTAAFCRRSGIFFHESHDHTCTGNTCFNNLQQVRFQFGERFPNDYIRNITFRNNILVAKETDQYALWARSSREDIPGYVNCRL
jgi:parallel beta-helix repeat protein